MINIIDANGIIKEAQDCFKCRCSNDYLDRGRHGPNCDDYMVDELEKVLDLVIDQESEISALMRKTSGVET